MRVLQTLVAILCFLAFATKADAQFSKDKPVALAPEFAKYWMSSYDLRDDSAARSALIGSGMLSTDNYSEVARLSRTEGGGLPRGFRAAFDRWEEMKAAVQLYKAYKLGEWTNGSARNVLLWVPAEDNAGIPPDWRPLPPLGMFMVVGSAGVSETISRNDAELAANLETEQQRREMQEWIARNNSTSSGVPSTSSNTSSSRSSSGSSSVNHSVADMSAFTANASQGTMILYYGSGGAASQAYVYELRGASLGNKEDIANALAAKVSAGSSFIGFEHRPGADCPTTEGYIKKKVGRSIWVICGGQHSLR